MNSYKYGVVVIALVLSGCQGQNPFSRQSNPVKDYPNATAAETAYVSGQQPPQAAQPDNSQEYCVAPMVVTVGSDPRKADVMEFTEGVNKEYKISITHNRGGALRISHDAPVGATFDKIDENGKTSVYSFSWTPGPKVSEGEAPIFAINYAGSVKSGCGASASKFIYISVRGGKLMPIVSFENMPKENLEFGKPSGEFQIVVDDPTSVKAPVLSIVSEAEAVNPESKVHDGSKGVDCDSKPAKIADNRWAFTCIFDSNLIKNIDTRLGTGQLIKAVFFAKAKSASGAAASVATPYYMMVQFPLIEKKSVTDAQPEEPKEEAVSNGIPVPTPRPSNQGAKQ